MLCIVSFLSQQKVPRAAPGIYPINMNIPSNALIDSPCAKDAPSTMVFPDKPDAKTPPKPNKLRASILPAAQVSNTDKRSLMLLEITGG
jgi:hypothetical protein